jgi:hypothetical protein
VLPAGPSGQRRELEAGGGPRDAAAREGAEGPAASGDDGEGE